MFKKEPTIEELMKKHLEEQWKKDVEISMILNLLKKEFPEKFPKRYPHANMGNLIEIGGLKIKKTEEFEREFVFNGIKKKYKIVLRNTPEEEFIGQIKEKYK